jgi:uncharacterized membrane protein YeaQ/YmgE (transglycosylase-associated protein family)
LLRTSQVDIPQPVKITGEEYMFIIWWIIVGLIAGWITGKLMSGGGYGALMDIVIGIVGAIIGGFIMRSLGFSGQGGMLYTILVAIGGAVILTLLLRLFTRGRVRQI